MKRPDALTDKGFCARECVNYFTIYSGAYQFVLGQATLQESKEESKLGISAGQEVRLMGSWVISPDYLCHLTQKRPFS